MGCDDADWGVVDSAVNQNYGSDFLATGTACRNINSFLAIIDGDSLVYLVNKISKSARLKSRYACLGSRLEATQSPDSIEQTITLKELLTTHPAPVPELANSRNAVVENEIAHRELLVPDRSTDDSTVERYIRHESSRAYHVSPDTRQTIIRFAYHSHRKDLCVAYPPPNSSGTPHSADL